MGDGPLRSMERIEYVGARATFVNGHRERLAEVDILWWVTADAGLFEETLGRLLLQFGPGGGAGRDASLGDCLVAAGAAGRALPRESGSAAVSFPALFRLYRRYATHSRRDLALSEEEWDLVNWLEQLGYIHLEKTWPTLRRSFVLMALNAGGAGGHGEEELLAIVRTSRALVEKALAETQSGLRRT